MSRYQQALSPAELSQLKEIARLCRGDILKMTTLAKSGHPAGSLSSLEMYLAVYRFADLKLNSRPDPQRDRVVISHGHTSPGAYAALARLGFYNPAEVIIGFRRIDSPYEGHVVRHLPGIDWSSGNLGQGLAAGCGFALALKMQNLPYRVFVLMSDAEQAKGQVAEARRFARKYSLGNLIVLIDNNHFQISGRVEEIMPVNIRQNYEADGWQVREIPGHDFARLWHALYEAASEDHLPTAIICDTIMGNGVSFMENKADYHGRPLNQEECRRALAELGLDDDLEIYRRQRHETVADFPLPEENPPRLDVGSAKTYPDPSDPRQVFGSILEEIGRVNPQAPMAVFDCDLAESVQTTRFARLRPKDFFEAGVSEHATATIAGALSTCGIVTIWGDFGVFGIDEVYNQLRLNDINRTHLKIFATHLGYNVGPDGKTHHCLDYVGLVRNLFGFRLVLPCDPNQTDHIVRYVLNQPGNWIIGVGRTKLPVIKKKDGTPFFDARYCFQYGQTDCLQAGNDAAIFSMGAMVNHALKAAQLLAADGIQAAVYAVSSPLAIDPALVRQAVQTGVLVAYEDHHSQTGLAAVLARIIAESGLAVRFQGLGITQYGASADPDDLLQKYGLDAARLAETVKTLIKS